MPNTFRELLGTRDIERFCSLFFNIVESDPTSLPALFKKACLYTSSCLYREQYPPPHHFVPHGYMSLITSWQVREYLRETDWWRPLIQALWHVANEDKSKELPVDRPIEESSFCPHHLDTAFSEAWDNEDFKTFYSLYAACQRHPKLRKGISNMLLSTAIRDHTNIGHKYIYMVKAIQLSQYTQWRDPLIFYAPIHFLVVVPKDLKIFRFADARLEPAKKNLENLANNQKTIEYVKALQLRDIVFHGQDEDVLELLIYLLTQGYSVESIADSLLLVASHIIYYAPYEDLKFWWLYPVHGFNFTQSVAYGLTFMETYEQILAILINGLYLREMVQSTGKLRENGSIESLDGENKASLERLQEAVENTNADDALNQVKCLIAKGIAFAKIAEKLVLLSSKTEKFLFSHVVKYLYYVLHSLKNSSYPWTNQHLIAFVKFLTLTIKDREVVRVAEEISKRKAK